MDMKKSQTRTTESDNFFKGRGDRQNDSILGIFIEKMIVF